MNEEIVSCVNAACNGNTDALARLYSGTLKMSYFLALKLSGSESAAAEITKKAYARAFCTITKLKKPEAFEIWMKQNVASVYKEGENFVFDDAEGNVPEGSFEFLSEDVFENSRKAAAALDAVDALRPEYRLPIVLHYFSGMPVQSLSKQLGVSESTVNSLLAKGREEIFAACESGDPSPVSGALPVLTRILQDQMSGVEISGETVKDIFSYALEIYKSFKHTEEVKAGEAPAPSDYFRSEPSIPSSGPKVPPSPGIPTDPDNAESGGIDFDSFADTPAPVSSRKKGFDIRKIRIGNLDFKKLAIIAAALLLVIIIVAAASHGKKNKGTDNTTMAGQTTAAEIKTGDYKWVPGGFENCADIQYLDENCCVFLSSVTKKYGLIDYRGNVLLQPNYDEFQRCGYGRDYESQGQYHTLVTIEGEQYFVSVDNGTAIISETPHGKHGVTPQDLDKKAPYDERDRFFEGYAAAEKNGKWGYIRQEDDKKVVPYEYEPVNDLSSGEASFCDYCRPVNNGLVAVKKNGVMGIINMSNDVIVPFEYRNIMVGDNGVFIANKDGTWGVILVGNAINTFTGVKIDIVDENGENGENTPPNTDEARTYICVADSGINVRSGPGGTYEDIGDLATGDEVEGYETKEAEDTGKTWLRIKMDNGKYGWVAIGYMQAK